MSDAKSSSSASAPLLGDQHQYEAALLDGPASLSSKRLRSEGQEEEGLHRYGVDSAFFHRLWLLMKNGFGQQWLKVLLVVVLSCVVAALNTFYDTVLALTMEAVGQEDWDGMWEPLATMVGVLLGVNGLQSAVYSINEYLVVAWREQLTGAMQGKLCFENNAYRLANSADTGSTDNMDERIGESARLAVNNFCYTTFGQFGESDGGADNSGLLLTFIQVCTSVFAIFYYTSDLTLPAIGLALSFVIGLFGIFFIMRPIARLTVRQNKVEAEFRARHAHNKMCSESVAFYKGEEQEHDAATTHFAGVLANAKLLITRTTYLYFFGSASFSVVGTVFPYAVVGLMFALLGDEYFDINPDKVNPDELSRKRITQYLVLVNTLARALGSGISLVTSINNYGPMIGDTHRCGALLEKMLAMEEASEVQKESASVRRGYQFISAEASSPPLPPVPATAQFGVAASSTEMIFFDDSRIAVKELTLCTPEGRVLMEHVSFEVPAGDSLVIMGPSGVGKSSILRAIAGLWAPTCGEIVRPAKIGQDGMYFLPQRPYISKGSLKANITYPDVFDENANGSDRQQPVSDARLVRVLRTVGLEHLYDAHGLYESHDWLDMLSGGEQQRLGFCRIFYHMPRFVVMDESTSALDEETEAMVMRACVQAGITMLSVAHRRSVVGYHKKIMVLSKQADGTASYEIKGVQRDEFPVCESNIELVDFQSEQTQARQRRTDSLEVVVEEIKSPSNEHNADLYVEVEPVHRDTSFAQLKLGAVSSGTDDKPAGLDAQVCRRFWFLWSLTFTGCCGGNVGRLWWILVCATLSGLSLAKVYLIMPYILSSVGDDDMRGMAMYIGSIAAMMMIYSCIDSYIFNMVAHVVLCWRADVVQQLQSRLFAPRVWYDGVKRDKRLPDLDQRTTGDVQKMTNAMTNLLLSVTSLPKCGIFFAVCLVQCPYSVVGITAYGVFVVLFLKWVLGSIPALVFTRETKEGEFRFLLIRVKTFSESISFYKGGARELVDLSDKLNELMGAFRAWIPPYCRGMFFARLASSMLYAMTLLCIVFETQFNPDWKDKDIDDVLGTYGTATSYAVTTMLLLSAISQFSVLAGHVNRVAETFGFVEEIRLRQEQEAGSITHEGPDAHAPVDYVELADLTVCVPSTLQSTKNDNPLRRKLFSEVNLTIRRGQSTIIMGRSGSGKSTLLRVIAGLWPVTEGTVTCPRKVGRGGMLFVPQSPYLPEGSLLEQIAYPGTRAQMEAYCRQQGTTSLATCERLLRITGLLHLEQEHGLREKLPWADMLSVGEQQRLAFCRVFYHQPLFVVMDESTSAMDLASQRACMEALAELKITAISVAHRPTLVQFHTQKLELIGSPDGSSVGTYKVSRIEEQ